MLNDFRLASIAATIEPTWSMNSKEAPVTVFVSCTLSVVMVPDSVQKTSHRAQQGVRTAVDLQFADQVAPEEELESFRYEVTAGTKLRVDGDPFPTSDLRVRATQSQQPEPRITPFSPEASPTSASIPRILVAQTRFSPQRRKKLPPWVASLFIHLVLILGLGFFTFTSFERQVDLTLSLESEVFAEDEIALKEIVIDPLEELDSDVNQLASEIQEASQLSASELSAEVALADLTDISGSENIGLGELSGLFGTHGSGLTEMVPAGKKLTASFFGAKVEGRRIVYVVDNSGGMRSGELETLVDELMKSVESLTDEQEFYVIFYSDTIYPLFYPQPIQRFIPANERFKMRLRQWLDTVELCLGNSVDQAIQAAASIHPDAVYLLTDGDVNTTPDGRKLAALLDARGRRFSIHTFGIGMTESTKAAANLRLVAEANHGTFRTVKVSAEAKEHARQQKRPYHNKEPGKVWGMNVGGGWGRK